MSENEYESESESHEINVGPLILGVCVIISLVLSTFSLGYFEVDEREAGTNIVTPVEAANIDTALERQLYLYRDGSEEGEIEFSCTKTEIWSGDGTSKQVLLSCVQRP